MICVPSFLGANVLNSFGLGDDLAAIEKGDAIITSQLQYYTSKGALIRSSPLGTAAGYDAPQYSIHRGKLWRCMYDKVKKLLGDDRVLCNHEFTKFTTNGTGAETTVTAHFTTYNGWWAGKSLEGKTLPSRTGDALIACDGIKSVGGKLDPA
jgi:2-polyprenyl-6-methoxyphenol hydroxylase-like FAD-dependent oxidoreductase